MTPLQEWIVKLDKVEMHKCERCSKAFLNVVDLIKHAKHHDNNLLISAPDPYVKIEKVNIFNCDYCRLGFLTKTEIELHRVEHTQKDYKNGRLYQKIQDLNQHKKNVHRVKVDTKTKAEYKYPIRKHRDILKVKLSPKQENVISHSEFAEQVTTILKGVRRAPLDVDFKTIEGKFQCPDCLKLYAVKKNVELHYRSIHRDERPYCCNVCNKSFTQGGPLIEHLKRHAGIKDFKCQYCDKLFYNIDAQDRHERTHTGSKPFDCSFCDKAFSDPSNLTRHERIHTEDKRYRCQLCPKAFTDHSGLNVHKKKHENI